MSILNDVMVQKVSFESSSNTELSNFFSSMGSEEGMLFQNHSQGSKDAMIQQNQQSQQNVQNQQDNTMTDDKQVAQENIVSQQDIKSVSGESSQITSFINSGSTNEVSNTNNDSNNNPFINNNNDDNNNTQNNSVSEVEVKKTEESNTTVNNSQQSVIDRIPDSRNTNDLGVMESVNNPDEIQNTIEQQAVDMTLEDPQKKDEKVMVNDSNNNKKDGFVKIVPTTVLNNKLGNQKVIVAEKSNDKKIDRNNEQINTKNTKVVIEKEKIKQETDWLIVDKDSEIEKLFVLLPPTIYRKEYKHKDNQNLPTVLYMKDYKIMFLKATYAEDIVAMNSILKKIKDVDFVDINGDTPLIWAVRLQKLQSVRFLLHKKADPYKKNKDGMNAIETALAFGNMPIIRALSTYASSMRLKYENE